MNFLKKNWFIVIIFLLSFVLFTYKLPTSTSFEGDLGRDLYEIARISYGKITLIGPKGSFGGIYTTPYYFYLFVPAFMLFSRELNGVLYFNALLFATSIVIFTYLASKKFGAVTSALSGLVMMIFPYFIMSARQPGNGFTPIPFFLVFMSILYFFDINKFDWKKTFAFGFFLGFILSMLFAYATVVLPLLLLIFILLKDKKKFFIFIAGFVLAFSPLLLFELKNHFIMFKNTFIDKSYLSFINNTNLPSGVKLNKNIFVNATDLANRMLPYFSLNVFLVFVFLGSSFLLVKNHKEKLFAATTFLSFIFLAAVLRFQYSPHYLLPFLTLLSFELLVTIMNIQSSNLLFTVAIVSLLISFPKSQYQDAKRNYLLESSRVQKLVAKNWIKKGDSYNIFLKRGDDAPTPAGNEYRFFLTRARLEPMSEFLYKDSSKLVIFSEKNNLDLNKINSWELSQFDLSKVKKISQFNSDKDMTIYLLQK